jgi:hypothetical protein
VTQIQIGDSHLFLARLLTVEQSGKGQVAPGVGTHGYVANATVPLSALPASGWAFDHWVGDVTIGTHGEPTVTLGTNQTVRAVFSCASRTLSLGGPWGEGTTVPPSGIYGYLNGQTATVTATAAPGWQFDHWDTTNGTFTLEKAVGIQNTGVRIQNANRLRYCSKREKTHPLGEHGCRRVSCVSPLV